MMYVTEPPRDKFIDKMLGACVYSFGILYGVWTFMLPANTIENEIGLIAIRYMALVTAIGSACCLVGVLLRRLLFESVFVWVVISGFVIYAAAVWGLFIGGSLTRGSQAFALTLLIFSLAWRGFRLRAVKSNNEKLQELEKSATDRLEGEL